MLSLYLCVQTSKCPEGTKPLLVFAGDTFESDNEHKRLKSLLIGRLTGPSPSPHPLYSTRCVSAPLTLLSSTDFFRGPSVPAVRLAGLEHILHFTALDGKIYLRSYR